MKEKADYIAYRLNRAQDALESADLLVSHKRYNAAINRFYYAAFYAVIALLLKDGIEAKTHAGTRKQFSLRYIKSGVIDKQYSKLYSDLLAWRERVDYGDVISFTEEEIKAVIQPTKQLVDRIIIEIEKV